jgi:hypothetical protein
MQAETLQVALLVSFAACSAVSFDATDRHAMVSAVAELRLLSSGQIDIRTRSRNKVTQLEADLQ